MNEDTIKNAVQLLKDNPELVASVAGMLGASGISGGSNGASGVNGSSASQPLDFSALKDRLGPLLSSLGGKPAEHPDATPTDTVGTASDTASPQDVLPTALLGSLSGGKAHKGLTGDKAAVILALKPFLSPNRRAAADAILQVGKLGDILGGILSGKDGT